VTQNNAVAFANARKVDKMKLQVVRTQLGKDATNGLLFIDGLFECYTLEDQYQAVKVMHETCIPEGTYSIKLRTVGGFDKRYKAKYPELHRGMLWIQDVPGFEYILIHQGNTDEHTSGCLIVGDSQQDLDVNFNGMVGSSANAYKKLYPKVSAQLLAGNEVTIEYSKIQLEPQEPNDVYEKLQEISGEIKVLNAKLSGRNIT
tara:strand:- start:1541 stop:2146 length:606 start_codon:yes stop_codon:yes gene_type:complete